MTMICIFIWINLPRVLFPIPAFIAILRFPRPLLLFQLHPNFKYIWNKSFQHLITSPILLWIWDTYHGAKSLEVWKMKKRNISRMDNNFLRK